MYLVELWLLFVFTRATLRKEFFTYSWLLIYLFVSNFTSKFQYTIFTLAWVKKKTTTNKNPRKTKAQNNKADSKGTSCFS